MVKRQARREDYNDRGKLELSRAITGPYLELKKKEKKLTDIGFLVYQDLECGLFK